MDRRGAVQRGIERTTTRRKAWAPLGAATRRPRGREQKQAGVGRQKELDPERMCERSNIASLNELPHHVRPLPASHCPKASPSLGRSRLTVPYLHLHHSSNPQSRAKNSNPQRLLPFWQPWDPFWLRSSFLFLFHWSFISILGAPREQLLAASTLRG